MKRADFAISRPGYFAPWIGRWVSADCAGLVDGPCLFAYVRGNPIARIDPEGADSRTVVAPAPGSGEYIPVTNVADIKPKPETKPEVIGRRDLDEELTNNTLLRNRIETVANELGIDPGLLAASLLAEEGAGKWSRTSGKIESEKLGLDDWFDPATKNL